MLPCPGWVSRVAFVMPAACPVYPQHQTFADPAGMSHLCQKQTFGILPKWSNARPYSVREAESAHGQGPVAWACADEVIE